MQHYTDNASVECVHDTNTSCDMSHHNATGSMDSAETNTGGWDNVLLVFLW